MDTPLWVTLVLGVIAGLAVISAERNRKQSMRAADAAEISARTSQTSADAALSSADAAKESNRIAAENLALYRGEVERSIAIDVSYQVSFEIDLDGSAPEHTANGDTPRYPMLQVYIKNLGREFELHLMTLCIGDSSDTVTPYLHRKLLLLGDSRTCWFKLTESQYRALLSNEACEGCFYLHLCNHKGKAIGFERKEIDALHMQHLRELCLKATEKFDKNIHKLGYGQPDDPRLSQLIRS